MLSRRDWWDRHNARVSVDFRDKTSSNEPVEISGSSVLSPVVVSRVHFWGHIYGENCEVDFYDR
jgi:hypothetical protein